MCQLPLLRLSGFNNQRKYFNTSLTLIVKPTIIELAETRSSSPHNALHPPSTCWGELERAPHRRVDLGFCHSRYIYIGIGGPTAIFETAPFLQPCTFFWPDLVDRKLHTEPRITRIPMHNTRLRSRAYCAHTDARPACLQPAKSTWRPVGSGLFSVSDSIDFNFKKILNSPECQRCRKVHIDACSRKARLSSAKYMTSSQIGFLDALNMRWV